MPDQQVQQKGMTAIIAGIVAAMVAGGILFVGSGGVIQSDDANYHFDNTNKRLGVQTNAPLGIVHAGNSSNQNSGDPAFMSSRSLTDANGTGSAHGFADNIILNRSISGAMGYNSFDARINITGASKDHYNGFQYYPNVNMSGTITTMEGFVSAPVVDAGTITELYGVNIANASGAGAITRQYGVYVGDLTKAGTNWGVYADGTTQNYFGGNVGLGVTPGEKLHLYGTGPYQLIEASGTAAAGFKLKKNNTQRWQIDMPVGDAGLAFTDSSSLQTLYLDQGTGTARAIHLGGNSSTPTVTKGTGAGTNGTVSVSGNDLSGTITVNTVNTDTSAASADIVTLTFARAYATAPRVLLTPSNDAAANLANGIWRSRQTDTTTALFKIRSGTTALPATTTATYTWNYHVFQ